MVVGWRRVAYHRTVIGFKRRFLIISEEDGAGEVGIVRACRDGWVGLSWRHDIALGN